MITNVLREVEGRQLPGTLAASKLRYFGHVMRKYGDSLEKDTVTETNEGERSKGRLPRSWMNNV